MAKKTADIPAQTKPVPAAMADEALEPSMEVETITPEIAKAYLENNIINRSTPTPSVKAQARDMAAGRWQLTMDAIRFNRDGQLIDGQHRLRACIEAKTPFQTLVVRNLPNETVNVIDSGRSRRASDVLAMRGFANAHLLAAAARWLLVMRHGLQGHSTNAILKPTNEEILEIVAKHPNLVESCRILRNPLGCTPSLLVAIHYVASNIIGTPELADAFVNVFNKGEPYYDKDDPALKLREMNLRAKQENKTFTARGAYINTVYVWNAFAQGRSIQTFRPPESASIWNLRPDLI